MIEDIDIYTNYFNVTREMISQRVILNRAAS